MDMTEVTAARMATHTHTNTEAEGLEIWPLANWVIATWELPNKTTVSGMELLRQGPHTLDFHVQDGSYV